MMNYLFDLAIRLFLSFLTAKLSLSVLGLTSPKNLVALMIFLTGLTYLIKFLETYYQRTWQSTMVELGWRVSRFFIGLNQLKHRKEK